MRNLYFLLVFMLLAISLITSAPHYASTPLVDPTEGFRLPTTVLPISYEIYLKPYILESEGSKEKRFTFDGKVSIILMTSKPDIKEIVLHAKNLIIDETKTVLNLIDKFDNPDESIEIDKPHANSTTDKYVLPLKTALSKDQEYKLTFIYTGKMDDDMHGFYKSKYTDKDGNEKWLASTQFQTIHARRAFPCFDEPSFKAIFQVTINCDKTFNAISNSIETGRKEIDDRFEISFDKTPKMSTYILAFLVSSFEERENTQKDFFVIARPEFYDQTEYSLEVGQKLLAELNEFTKKSYLTLGIPKMHMAAIPDFSAGAMENWGLLTYRERALLYDPKETTALAQQKIAMVIAHEQAHMWFGDLVTCDWWSYTWLNEGFARYLQYFITHEVNKDWELDKQFVVDQIHSVMNMDSLPNTYPLTDLTVKTYEDISKMFGSISYNKGSSVIRMFQHTMGENVFNGALQKYLKDKEYQNSVPNDLFNQFKAEWNFDDIDMDTFFKDWTMQVGYPLVTIELDASGEEISVKQKRFMLKDNADDDKTLYTIPFTYTSNVDSDFDKIDTKFIANKSDVQKFPVNGPAKWVIGNIQQVGYYRVNYDDKTWYNIYSSLLSNDWGKIPEINRAQIVDDLMNLGRSGILRYNLVINILGYLKTETNYLPWTAALNGFSFISKRIELDDIQEFNNFVLELLGKVYNQLGFEEKESDSRLDIYNRPNILSWACKYGHSECIQKSTKYFNEMKLNKVPVPVNIRSAVYCSAIRNGELEDYEYLVKKYEESTVVTEQDLILSALGCVNDADTIEKYYNYIISNKVRLQDKASSLSSLYSQNPKKVFSLINLDYKKLGNALGGGDGPVANILSGMANLFSTEKAKNNYLNFLANHTNELSESAKRTISNAIETIDSNIKFTDKYMKNYMKHIKSKSNKGYRLPKSILPEKYTIKLTPYLLDTEGDLGKDQFTFDGEVSIHLRTTDEDINQIVLHAKNLNIDTEKTSLNVVDDPTDIIEIDAQTLDPNTDKYVIKLKGALSANKMYSLNFIYTGQIGNDNQGFFRSSYKDKDGNERWVASTQFQTVHARKAFPCFDEPSFKAKFNIIISHHESFSSVSNMPLKEPSKVDGNRVIDSFQETPKMSSYIVAFLVSDFIETKNEKNDFIIIARPTAENQTEFSLGIGQEILKELDSYTQQPYYSQGVPKMHMAAIPRSTGGAMENWGLITYGDPALLYDPNEVTDSAQQGIVSVIAHEQAHMWFGNLVTCDWWGHTWLNEGFATYFQYLMTHLVKPEWEFDKQMVIQQIHSVMNFDSSEKTHPMSDPAIENVDDVSKMFDSISYNKGGTILRMIDNTMGDDKFKLAIQKYLKDRKYTNTIPDDLFKYLKDEWKPKDVNVEQFFLDWTTQVGYPVITITMNKDKKSFDVKQERYLSKPNAGDKTLTYTVPFTYTTSKTKDFNSLNTIILPKNNEIKNIPLGDGKTNWIVGNIRQIGYYRVNYDTDLWHGIHHALMAKDWSGIHEINRAQIVNDLMSFGQSDYLQYDLIFNILDYLETETNYLPWTAAFNGFSHLATRLGSDNKKEYSHYILKLIKKVYDKLGFDEKDKDTRLDKYNRPTVLLNACYYGNKNCIDKANQHFKNLQKNNKNVPVNLRLPVYCSAVREGKNDEYEFLRKRYEDSAIPTTEKLTILNALGCIKDLKIIEIYYKYILSTDKIPKSDKNTALTALLKRNLENPDVIFSLSLSNFKELGEALGGNKNKEESAAKFIASIADYFTNSKQTEVLDKFCADNDGKISEKALETMKGAIKSSKENIEWSEKHLPKVVEYLVAKRKKGSGAINNSVSVIVLTISIFVTYVFYY